MNFGIKFKLEINNQQISKLFKFQHRIFEIILNMKKKKKNPKMDSSLEIEPNHPPFLRFRDCGNCLFVSPVDSVNISRSESSPDEYIDDNLFKPDVSLDRITLIDENDVDVAAVPKIEFLAFC